MEAYVKFLAVTGPLLGDRRPLLLRPSDIRGMTEEAADANGFVNTILFVNGFGQPLVVSGSLEQNYARLNGAEPVAEATPWRPVFEYDAGGPEKQP